MLAAPERPLVYGRQGGSPPRSFELLSISADGAAQYVAANPWPAQPPFDEIGEYTTAIDAQALTDLVNLAMGLAGDHDGGAPSRDAGIEYVEAWSPDRGATLEWNPLAPSPHAMAFIHAVRGVVAAARTEPVSVVRASLELEGGGERAAVVLAAEGRQPFRLAERGVSGSAMAAGAGDIEVRTRVTESSEWTDPSAIPAALVHAPPVSFDVGVGSPGPHGKVELPLGESARFTVPIPEGARLLSRGRLEALVRLAYPMRSLTGEFYVQEGWLLPDPIQS